MEGAYLLSNPFLAMLSKGKKPMELNEVLQEEAIWSTQHVVKRKLAITTPKVIPKPKSATISSHSEATMPQRSSAPLNVPNPFETHNKKSSSRFLRNGRYCGSADDDNGVDEDNDSDDDIGMVPPHEYLARRLARKKVTSSMCEGIGRTLKGRDLSKVRNAILTKTGFLE